MAKARIPGGVAPEHFMEIRNLLNRVVKDIDAVTGREPKWVSSRLNETGRDDPSPFFVGWVENDALKKERVNNNLPDPGLFRFADNIYTQLYAESLKGSGIVRRNWTRQRGERLCKNLYVSNIGAYDLDMETHRLSIAIKADGHYVGTLNAGFSKDPGTSANKTIESWAQDSKSALVQYLNKEFELGGPSKS
jgi:hypothetical protein